VVRNQGYIVCDCRTSDERSSNFTTRYKTRAKLSPTLYKGYNNQLLDILRDNNIGAKIGTTFIGCPTVADDIALIKRE
jgi:hypothetical protein